MIDACLHLKLPPPKSETIISAFKDTDLNEDGKIKKDEMKLLHLKILKFTKGKLLKIIES